jgi:FkbM family methyltransferase
MVDERRTAWSRVTARLPVRVQRLAGSTWLLQAHARRGAAMRVERLDGSTWVVQRRGESRRHPRQIGPPRLRTHLLVNERAARRDMNQLQKRLGDYLAREQIAWVLRELGITCVLDVGANVGQYAKMLRRAGYTGRIVSFEPLPHLVEELRRESRDDPDWVVMDCALGDEDTKAEINVVRGTMSSMLEPSEFGEGWSSRLRDREDRTETVSIRRLDGLLDEAVAGLDRPRVYLTMDTQGFDLQAFAGAGDRVDEILGLQSELSCVPIYDGMPRLPEQLKVYEEKGFEVTGLFPVSRHVQTLRVIEFDVVMVRPEAVRGAAAATEAPKPERLDGTGAR